MRSPTDPTAGAYTDRRPPRSRRATGVLLVALLHGCGVLVPEDDVLIENVSPGSFVLEVGESAGLTVAVSSREGRTAQILFESRDASVATIEATGLTTARVTGVAPGTTTVTAVSPDYTFSVAAIPVQVVPERHEVELDPRSARVAPGQTTQLTCTVSVVRTGAELPGEPVTYTSSNTNVATVDANGVVMGVAEGSASITCQAQDAAPTTAGVEVVIPRVVEIDPATADLVVGEALTFACTTRHAVTGEVVNDTYDWLTSDANVATVDQNGQVLAVGEGTATISCSPGHGYRGAATVTVRLSRYTVEVTPATLGLAPGQTSTVTCTVRDAVTGVLVTGQPYSWYSNDESVARVDANGVVSGIAPGRTVIVCELDAGGAGSAEVTVTTPPAQQPLCAPGRSDTNVLKAISSILRGDLTSFCSNATSDMDTGPVTHMGEQKPRALDYTSILHAGGVPSWSLGSVELGNMSFSYPCGPNARGYTACRPGMTGPLPEGDYVMVYAVLHAPLPSTEPGALYRYAFTFDRDADPANNYTDMSVQTEFFRGTDFWLLLEGQPGGPWQVTGIDARDNILRAESTSARAVIDGATIFLLVPREHFDVDDPPLRFSIYHEDANGDWTGDVQRPVDQRLFFLPIRPPGPGR